MIGWLSRHALVDRHFAGQGGGAADRRMFRHLRRCAGCRGRYRSHALLEALEPRGEQDARLRMERGLFPARPTPAQLRPGLLALAGAAVALLLFVKLRTEPFQARSLATFAPRAALTLYRVPVGGAPERTGSVVRADDALAFSYVNPTAHGYLMVFAYDGAGRVFWFWPAWRNSTSDPQALPIAAGNGAVELGEAVRHPLTPGALTLVGLFLDRPASVHQVETALGAGGLGTLGGEAWEERLEVLP